MLIQRRGVVRESPTPSVGVVKCVAIPPPPVFDMATGIGTVPTSGSVTETGVPVAGVPVASDDVGVPVVTVVMGVPVARVTTGVGVTKNAKVGVPLMGVPLLGVSLAGVAVGIAFTGVPAASVAGGVPVPGIVIGVPATTVALGVSVAPARGTGIDGAGIDTGVSMPGPAGALDTGVAVEFRPLGGAVVGGPFVGVFVGVLIGAVVHALGVKRLLSNVTAPLRANARPATVAPVVTVTLVSARILPTNAVLVPRVAELPTCQ